MKKDMDALITGIVQPWITVQIEDQVTIKCKLSGYRHAWALLVNSRQLNYALSTNFQFSLSVLYYILSWQYLLKAHNIMLGMWLMVAWSVESSSDTCSLWRSSVLCSCLSWCSAEQCWENEEAKECQLTKPHHTVYETRHRYNYT